MQRKLIGMIITKINGGLGNQMFQYSLGRVLSHLNRSDLKLDLSAYDNQKSIDTIRNYELNIFSNINSSMADKITLNSFTKPNKLKLLLNHFLKFKLNAYPKNWIKEINHEYNKNILNLRGDFLLDGYWQNEKYFKNYRNLILKDFTFPKLISKNNMSLIKTISGKKSVAIHVRRGDYITNKYAKEYHGLASITYYKKSIELIKTKVNNPLFVVLSDDSEWCMNNLPVPKNSIFVDHNKNANSFEDMRVMSLCEHNIIANSSFSWWGAWLNINKYKIVIAPDPWFKNKADQKNEIIPNEWIKIKS